MGEILEFKIPGRNIARIAIAALDWPEGHSASVDSWAITKSIVDESRYQATLRTWKPNIFGRDAQHIIDEAVSSSIDAAALVVAMDGHNRKTVDLYLPSETPLMAAFDFARENAAKEGLMVTSLMGQIILSKPVSP